MGDDPGDLSAQYRAEFPVTAHRAYLFSGGIAPAATRVSAAVVDWIERWATDPGATWEHLLDETEIVRGRLAHLLGCPPDSVAVTDGTSRGANIAVAMLAQARPARPANVVVDRTTYPSSLLPWFLPTHADVEVRWAADGADGPGAGLDSIARLVDRHTIAVTVTHVDPLTGFRHDLASMAEVAHAQGAALVVDVAQSAGLLPLDLSSDGIDVAFGTAMKWLLGPPGIGFLAIAPSLLAQTGAPQIGYLGGEPELAADGRPVGVRLRPDARRHELGLPNLLGMPGFAAGLELIVEADPSAIEAHVERLVTYCMDGLSRLHVPILTPPDPAHRAGLVAIPWPDAEVLGAFLRGREVDVWAYDPEHLIRVDPHLFNDTEDIDRFVSGMSAFLAAGARPPVRSS